MFDINEGNTHNSHDNTAATTFSIITCRPLVPDSKNAQRQSRAKYTFIITDHRVTDIVDRSA